MVDRKYFVMVGVLLSMEYSLAFNILRGIGYESSGYYGFHPANFAPFYAQSTSMSALRQFYSMITGVLDRTYHYMPGTMPGYQGMGTIS